MKKIYLTVGMLAVLCNSAAMAEAWEERYYNPKPLDDDVVLPMPCEGAMVFRKVHTPTAQPLDDYKIQVGADNQSLGHVEQVHDSYIAGSFAENDGQSRYYLMAKYELSQLQYQALTAENCPKPSNRLRLPQTGISWFDAMSFANQYNQWLLANHADALPSEDGARGFLRMPTETEWEFAARGGMKVNTVEFRESLYPMPEQGGISSYEWFAGTQSAAGKTQLTGLLAPNPLGLHDILGNVDEIVFEPFRLNKLDRAHGQAGGYVIRGGSYLTSQADLRASLRTEKNYYDNEGASSGSGTGVRYAVVAPALTSLQRIKQIQEAWQQLGTGEGGQTGEKESVLVALNQLMQKHESLRQSEAAAAQQQERTAELEAHALAQQQQDDALHQELKNLENKLRAENQRREEAEAEGIFRSLKVNAFLCVKVKDDSEALDSLESLHRTICDKEVGSNPDNANCPARAQQLAQRQKLFDLLGDYYVEQLMVLDGNGEIAADYLNAQFKRSQTRLEQSPSDRNLIPYVKEVWKHHQVYRSSPVALDVPAIKRIAISGCAQVEPIELGTN